MKNLLLIIFVTLTLVGTLCAASHSVLAANNAETILMDEGLSCRQAALLAISAAQTRLLWLPSDGAPMPVCAPGKNCSNDTVAAAGGRWIADAGVRSGQELLQRHSCSCGPAMARRCRVCIRARTAATTQLQLRADDGSPMPVCAPGKNCSNGTVAAAGGRWIADAGVRAGQELQQRHSCSCGRTMDRRCRCALRARTAATTQLQLRADDGSPMPVCAPGKNCSNGTVAAAGGRWIADAGVRSGQELQQRYSCSCGRTMDRRCRCVLRARTAATARCSCGRTMDRRCRCVLRARTAAMARSRKGRC